MSTFAGIEVGSRALAASQRALDTVGHNTANVNTPGYSRQVVNLQATDPYTVPGYGAPRLGQIGTGVTVSSITRIRDQFIDNRVRTSLSNGGAASQTATLLKRVEQAFTEPGDTGIGSQMTKFFNSFSDLASHPESSATRATVTNAGQNVAASFRTVDAALKQINPEINTAIGLKVDDINSLATQLASLNMQISQAIGAGERPNDLQDRQGALLDTLSQLVDIKTVADINSTTGQPTGEISVSVGGYGIVQGSATLTLPKTPLKDGKGTALITETGAIIALKGGELTGLVEASQLVDTYATQLNDLATQFVSNVNSRHKDGVDLTGTPGIDFFTGTDAGSIKVSTLIANNSNLIAASSKPLVGNPFAPGNGDNARALSQLSYTKQPNNYTLNEYYNTNVSRIGADSKSFQDRASNTGGVVAQLQSQQASVSGVSLDEELTRMLQFQKSYQASAKIVNVMDGILDTLINGLGVGR
ncbi:MAG: flagellar hook-associated protein FlgK [Chthonomonadaceae bacterium]|nr:flagellar hook-associated protein FlgK [Chthonomonadaceae bacterium]